MMITPVPFEFLGLGRRFRDQIVDADDRALKTMIGVFKPLARRADRSTVSRPELLQDAVRLWRQKMPSVGLLDSKIQMSRRDLHIREVRVGAGTACAPWNAATDEPVISIVLVELRVAKDVCRLMVDPVVLLPLHALARWYQRSLDNSDAALLTDLAQMASAYGEILHIHTALGNRKFLCPATSGLWAGSVTERLSEATGRQEQVLSVRTFLPGGTKDTKVATWSRDQEVLPRRSRDAPFRVPFTQRYVKRVGATAQA
jgi:hypothetical protein